jgi:hypothetical protein
MPKGVSFLKNTCPLSLARYPAGFSRRQRISIVPRASSLTTSVTSGSGAATVPWWGLIWSWTHRVVGADDGVRESRQARRSPPNW